MIADFCNKIGTFLPCRPRQSTSVQSEKRKTFARSEVSRHRAGEILIALCLKTLPVVRFHDSPNYRKRSKTSLRLDHTRYF